MIIYNVTVNVESSVEKEWLKWMQEIHIPDVMKTGLFVENKILRLLSQNEGEIGTTYAIQYACKSMKDFEIYQKNHAPVLQQEHLKRYKDKCLAFRTMLETVD